MALNIAPTALPALNGASVSGQPGSLSSLSAEQQYWAVHLEKAFLGGHVISCISAYVSLATEEEKAKYFNEHCGGFAAMPTDFVPVGKQLKPKKKDQTPLLSRRNHVRALYRGPAGGENQAISSLTDEQLEERIQELRLGAHKWGLAYVQSHLLSQLRSMYPDLRHGGKELQTVDDVDNWVKVGKFDKEKKEVLAYIQHHAWGGGNQWAVNAEKEFCQMCGIRWLDQLSNGDRMMKPPLGKCFAAIFVKAKGSLCTRIRNRSKVTFRAAVYVRNEGDDDDDFGESVSGTVVTESGASEASVVSATKAKRRRKGIPKLVCQVIANMDDDGFWGKVGYCEGHKDLAEILQKQGKQRTLMKLSSATPSGKYCGQSY